jgi:hypothetical protein
MLADKERLAPEWPAQVPTACRTMQQEIGKLRSGPDALPCVFTHIGGKSK